MKTILAVTLLLFTTLAHALPGTSAAGSETTDLEITASAQTVSMDQVSAAEAPKSFHKTVMAHFYYNCHHGGADSRVFSWESSYSYADHLLHMQGLRNVDSLDKITVSKQYFNTHWHHSTCIYGGDTVCHYAFRGYTFGHIAADEMALDLVTSSDDDEFAPSVRESCVEKHLMPKNFCSATFIKRVSVECELDEVDAFAI